MEVAEKPIDLSQSSGVSSSFWDYLMIAGGSVGMLPLQALSMAMTARILGREGYGHIALFTMVADCAFLASVSWSLAAVLRFGREEFARTGKLNRTFWARNALALPMLALLGTISLVFQRPIAGYMQVPLWVVWLLVAQVATRAVTTSLQYILQATQRMRSLALVQVFGQLANLVGLALIFGGWLDRSYLAVVSMGIAMSLLSAVLMIWLLPRRLLGPVSWDRPLTREVFGFSYPIVLGSLSAYIEGWVDVIVIHHYFPLAEVGGYRLAYRVMTFAQALSLSVVTISTPILIVFLADRREDLIRRYALRMVAQGTLAWSVVVALGMAVAPLAFHLAFGGQFLSSATYLELLALGLAMNILTSFYSGVLMTYKLIKLAILANGVMALINLGGDLALVPLIGPSGAALSTSLGFAAAAVLYLFFVQRRLGIDLMWQAALVLPALVVLALRGLLGPQAILLPAVAALIAGYGLARRLRLFQAEDLPILDKVRMPALVRRGMTQAVTFLSR